jgi:hypothetical protein
MFSFGKKKKVVGKGMKKGEREAQLAAKKPVLANWWKAKVTKKRVLPEEDDDLDE